ncbi:7-carboxy-7-deazaguanine synthase [Marinobacterium nitratireducens]|uniref:7-carboxy-7-deazaguanine synthase n=1 Tax=Marinobacterium nitratireducens TaxID=518897 RepID=A0A917Z853_9GAMM|nr:7-carboxy-7-deazaguanine synthase [Marinobacterium nitratireducens]GGO75763.1 7-carboxy-7-deazaguanine synthase [Marinobacterium nitratireducens]
MYSVKEMFYTLQGEGAQSGRPAVFCRFAGCNLWSGREQDRSGAICDFCDTDFVGTDGQNGGKFATPQELATAARSFWPAHGGGKPYLVCTGGEPALQLDAALIEAFHAAGFEIAVETNGTRPLPDGIDWICVSPKAGTELVVTRGQELKLVYPQLLAPPERFDRLEFEHFYLQALDGPDAPRHQRQCIEYCLAHPQWKLSLQSHKILGID